MSTPIHDALAAMKDRHARDLLKVGNDAYSLRLQYESETRAEESGECIQLLETALNDFTKALMAKAIKP